MSFPTIPQITPTISLDRGQVINLLLASIAFEELGLAHIINAEGEKIQAVLGTLPGVSMTVPTFYDILTVDQAVRRTLQTVLKTQMLLQFKLEDVLDIPIPPFIAVPSIVIEKLVSVDGGVTFVDADTPPGPNQVFPINPVYEYVVTNTGNVSLDLVTVVDSVFGVISLGGTLAPGASSVQTHAGTWAPGSFGNAVTVTGVYQGQQVEDTDVAWFNGVTA